MKKYDYNPKKIPFLIHFSQPLSKLCLIIKGNPLDNPLDNGFLANNLDKLALDNWLKHYISV